MKNNGNQLIPECIHAVNISLNAFIYFLLAAIPDFIRLVHGNIWSFQKIVKEFREYWSLQQTKKDATKSPAGEQNSPMADGDQPRVSTPESHNHSGISKRQLELKMRAIAVYEKRPDFFKACWYVSDKVREEHNLKDLPVPTTWEWITRTNVKTPKTPATPQTAKEKTENRCSTPTASIKQFVVPQDSPVLLTSTPPAKATMPKFASPSLPSKSASPLTRIPAQSCEPVGAQYNNVSHTAVQSPLGNKQTAATVQKSTPGTEPPGISSPLAVTEGRYDRNTTSVCVGTPAAGKGVKETQSNQTPCKSTSKTISPASLFSPKNNSDNNNKTTWTDPKAKAVIDEECMIIDDEPVIILDDVDEHKLAPIPKPSKNQPTLRDLLFKKNQAGKPASN